MSMAAAVIMTAPIVLWILSMCSSVAGLDPAGEFLDDRDPRSSEHELGTRQAARLELFCRGPRWNVNINLILHRFRGNEHRNTFGGGVSGPLFIGAERLREGRPRDQYGVHPEIGGVFESFVNRGAVGFPVGADNS